MSQSSGAHACGDDGVPSNVSTQDSALVDDAINNVAPAIAVSMNAGNILFIKFYFSSLDLSHDSPPCGRYLIGNVVSYYHVATCNIL